MSSKLLLESEQILLTKVGGNEGVENFDIQKYYLP